MADEAWRTKAARWTGVALTLLVLLLVEATSRGPLPLPPPLPTGIFLLALAAVVASAFLGGVRPALASAALIVAYTPRLVAEPPQAYDLSPEGLRSMAVMAVIAFSIAGVTGWLKRRDDRLHERLLHAERERAESIEQSRRALKEKNEELERANRALAAVNDGLESFAYVVSHDLKEPVRAMTVYLEDAQERAVRPDVRESIQHAQEANGRLARLLQGLLEVSRATRLDPHDLAPIDMRAALESPACATRYGDLYRERGARLETLVLQGTPPALATMDHLCQILGNLLVNAVKHNDKTAPRVRVSVSPQDAEARMVEVTVEDDGPGFDPRVADRLGRLKPGRPATLRGGFGLVIVRRAVERLGGHMWIDRSEELGGAAVHFTLPTPAPREELARSEGDAREGAPHAGARPEARTGERRQQSP